jgi:photosystem II stability/assembly factor-like uncharacterized protein
MITSSCENNPDPIVSSPNGNGNAPEWGFYITELFTDLTDVHFVNSSAGWVVGSQNRILSSSDGGNTWPFAPVVVTPKNFKKVFLINEQLGWFIGSEEDDENSGEIFISKTGGAYPELQENVDVSLNAIFFIDDNEGWVGGNGGVILHTRDQGITWETKTLDNAGGVNDLYFTDNENGWAVTSTGEILRTTDGDSWTVEEAFVGVSINSLHMLDSVNGWACGDRNTLFYRGLDENGEVGWDWARVGNEFADIMWNDIYFLDKQTGWVVGSNGKAYKTSDGGFSWSQEPVPAFGDLNAVHFISEDRGFVVGDEGVLLVYR